MALPLHPATHHQHFDRFPEQFLVQLMRFHRSALPDRKIPQSFHGFTEISAWKPFLSRQASPQAHEATAMSGEPDGTQSMCEVAPVKGVLPCGDRCDPGILRRSGCPKTHPPIPADIPSTGRSSNTCRLPDARSAGAPERRVHRRGP